MDDKVTDVRISDEELSALIYSHRDSRHVSKEQTLERLAFNELFILRQAQAAQRQAGREERRVECERNAAIDAFRNRATRIQARYAALEEAAREANGIHDLVRNVERDETYTDGEPELGTCRTFGQIKTIVLKLRKALADIDALDKGGRG